MRSRSALTLLFAGTLAFLPVSAADEFDILDINEGELRFLERPPEKSPHLHSTHVFISEESFKTGWVTAKQCHYHLDQVSALQVVFNKRRVRRIEILQADNIGRAWVEGASVQVTHIGKNAVLCILSENFAIKHNPAERTYEWHGGPYMRRFLDGYFPMQVKLAIDYPSDHVRLESIEPGTLRFKTVAHPGLIRLDALFEGRLDITIRFADAGAPKQGIGWQ
ncbi:MAG: hypothetical protein HY083_01410 [Gammaproteobacteria bacterium]|nr:hypothetical protein [Gammaproteobacteria bacterium]